MYHKWTCNCCGKEFDDLPMSFAVGAPDPYFALAERERKHRTAISSDACIIDNKHFYVLGCIELPVAGFEMPFVWNIWVSLSQTSFDRVGQLWETDIRTNEPPFFGWLANAIAIYPDTYALKTSVQLRDRGARPTITLEQTDHPLAVEQRDGISIARVEEIATMALSESH
jgi:hypothetical protein